jgi:hypothetical protein
MPNNIELRDYFAGCVLQGLLANSHLQKEFLKDTKKILKDLTGEEHNENISVSSYMQYHHTMIAYSFADAMIEKKEGDKNGK